MLIIAAALLIGWSIRSFRGKSGKLGLAAAIVNLLTSAFVIFMMSLDLGEWNLIIPVVILIALLAVAALVMAIWQRRA